MIITTSSSCYVGLRSTSVLSNVNNVTFAHSLSDNSCKQEVVTGVTEMTDCELINITKTLKYVAAECRHHMRPSVQLLGVSCSGAISKLGLTMA